MVDKVKKKNAEIAAFKKKVAKKKVQKKVAAARKKVAKKKTGTITKKKVVKNNNTKSNKNQATADRLKGNKPKSNRNQATADRLKGNKSTTKKKPGTLKRLGKVASKALRSPVGKFGPLGAAVTGAYFLGEEFFPNKKKKPVAKKPVAKKKAPIKKRKLSPGESKIRKSDIMGGSKGRLSGPKGPLGGKLDKRKKSTVVKNRNKRFNPRKANRAGQKFGQR